MSIVINPFRLINKENICKYTQEQHDNMRNNYEKIYKIARDIEEYIFQLDKYKKNNDNINIIKINEKITNLNKEYEELNIIQHNIFNLTPTHSYFI